AISGGKRTGVSRSPTRSRPLAVAQSATATYFSAEEREMPLAPWILDSALVNQRMLHDSRVQGRVPMISARISRFSGTRPAMPPSRTVRKLCQVRDLIRDCLEEELTLADLSLEADLSAWHFLRAFRQAFGETPKAFLTRLRLERAKELLTISTRSVTEI